MYTFTRGVVSLALLTTATVLLTGCAMTDQGPRSGSTATTEPSSSATSPATETPAAATVDFGHAPHGPDAPSCSTLLPSDLVASLVPGVQPRDVVATSRHAIGSLTTVRVAGGTDCSATNGVPLIDDVVPTTRADAAYEGVVLSVLPDAAAAFRDAGEQATTPLESSTEVRCDASDSARVFCHGGVLAGTAWVDVDVVRLQTTADATPEDMLPTFRALLDGARSAVAESPAGTATGDDATGWAFTPCSPERLNAVTSVALRDSVSGTDTAPGIGEYAQGRIGSDVCRFVAEDGRSTADAVFSSTPGAAWVVEQRLAAGLIDRAGRIELPDLGARDAAWRTCDDTACTVDVVHDATWTQYFLTKRVAPDTSSAVQRWAESSFSSAAD
jgi:hypothetical protein